MKFSFLLTALVIITASACNTANKKIKERISVADSVAINYFTGDGKMDTVVAVKIIRDKKTILQLADLIAAHKKATIGKCGYDGSLHFFKENAVMQDIDFRMNDVNCMQFSFLQEGKPVAAILSAEAKQLLESIRK